MSRYYSSVKHRKWQRHYHLDEREVDPVVAAATAHLNSPVVFNFVDKASLAACVIHGTASPSMNLGSFSSGASGFPFNNDADINSGLSSSGAAGAFLALYGTSFDQSVNANCVYLGDGLASDYVIRGTSTITRAYYGQALQAGSTASGLNSLILSAGGFYEDGSLTGAITPSSFAGAATLYIGGFAGGATRACKCNMVYAVYAPSIATSAAAAASAIHSAMVAGAP